MEAAYPLFAARVNEIFPPLVYPEMGDDYAHRLDTPLSWPTDGPDQPPVTKKKKEE